jgi:hypothetical protein
MKVTASRNRTCNANRDIQSETALAIAVSENNHREKERTE